MAEGVVDVAAAGMFTASTSVFKNPGADSVHLRQADYTTGASGTSFAAPLETCILPPGPGNGKP